VVLEAGKASLFFCEHPERSDKKRRATLDSTSSPSPQGNRGAVRTHGLLPGIENKRLVSLMMYSLRIAWPKFATGVSARERTFSGESDPGAKAVPVQAENWFDFLLGSSHHGRCFSLVFDPDLSW
jgi:hypothetical protein